LFFTNIIKEIKMKETEMGGNLIGHGKDEIARRLVILVGKQE
jgi:hypothetical protein